MSEVSHGISDPDPGATSDSESHYLPGKETDEVDSQAPFPPVEERSGPEGAEEEAAGGQVNNDDDEEEDEEKYDTVPPTIDRLTSSQVLPWGAPKERSRFPSSMNIETDIRSGEFVMRTLFAEFTIQAERKINSVMSEPLERPIAKSLQRGEDPQFDQVLSAFGAVADHCLPSILRTLFAWYERQGVEWCITDFNKGKGDSKGKSDLSSVRSELEFLAEKRDLSVEFIFCLVLIEVLKQLSIHPGHEDLVLYLENLAFKHFRYRDSQMLGPNAANIHMIADLYAEVLGVLAQSRFQSTKKRFFAELRELRSREPSTHTTQSIISLLMGMKFFRVKMVPFEDFEQSFQFMNECAQYFLEVKDKDIKHAVAGLFVEILVPVAAAVKNEVNVPCLKNFVEKLYSQTLDMCTRSKHRLAIFPLVTCLLCVSQKAFFLHNWHYFLTMCLQHLKNRDSKMARVALESLYRLLWVYMIRIKCESNNVTQSRLQSIVNSLFPKGSKAVVPRDTPLNIFVKIIQFIAQEKLDFAMREIVFDLLSVGRPIKVINAPERMSIGLRAFLVVADSLQQKEGEPPMPRTVGVMPSGSTMRVKKTFLNKMLTDDTAKSIGLSSYYPYVRKVFDDILRALDAQFGKPFLITNTQNTNKEADDAKPKLDLFRTVVAAIPRLLPDGMSRSDLVDTLSRLTVHNDEELRGLAFQSLQNLVIDFPDWREDVLYGFMQFVVKDILDQQSQLLDNALRMVFQLLTAWRNAIDRIAAKSYDTTRHDPNRPDLATTLHMAEGFAMVMLCHCRIAPRRLAVHILKEVKTLFKVLGALREDMTVIEALDKCTQMVVESNLHLMPLQDKTAAMAASSLDFQWLIDRTSMQWTAGFNDDGTAKSGSTQHLFTADPWSACLLGFLQPDRLPSQCPSAMLHTWPTVHTRLTQLFTVVDPAPVTDNRASLLRPGTAPKKVLNEKDIWMHLWKNYIAFACRVVPAIPNPVIRCVSPDLILSSSPESLGIDRSDSKSPSPMISPTVMYKLLVPLLRCEVSDMRDSVVQALGRINHIAIMDLLGELVMYIREAIDRKQENMRRRRRRDALRLQLVRVFEIIAEQGTFSRSTAVTDSDTGGLSQTITDYMDGARQYLENESDKDVPIVTEIKIHFSLFIRQLIRSFTLERRRNLLKRELRRNLFYLFSGWSGKYGHNFESNPKNFGQISESTEFQLSSLQSMITVLCCGPIFDESLTAEDGDLYNFLDMLLESSDEKIYSLAQETIVLLLEFNPDISTLLDWVVDRCFTGSDRVADGCFLALSTIFATREYPCDHYTGIINVALMNTGCPRTLIHETALQLLQILDNRFFGSGSRFNGGENTEKGLEKERSTLDVLLSTTYSRSQLYLSRQLAQLHPELTMPMFSEICHRLQTARPSRIKCLLYYLLPWLYNMELVDASVNNDDQRAGSGAREGWGSSEATEMVTNNLFYITVKFSDEHPKEVEELWAAMCACWPKNLRVIVRYLFIISGLAPSELIEYAKRVILYVGRAQPVRTLDDLMNELQTVETLNCTIERTETPPYYRLTSLRKASSNSESNVHLTSSRTDLASTEKGTIHTKRHSQEDPQKESRQEMSLSGSLRSAGSMASSAGSAMVAGIQRVGEKVRALSGSTHQHHPREAMTNSLTIPTTDDHITLMNEKGSQEEMAVSSSQPMDQSALYHPLPMPEYGGWFAPLTEFLPDPSQPISNFHRCNLSAILLTDLVVDGLDLDCHSVDWSVHVPLMLHIIFLGLDNSRPLVFSHCQRLLLNLLIVLGEHGDHLSVSNVLMESKTGQLDYGLALQPNTVKVYNFLERESTQQTSAVENLKDSLTEDDEAVQMKTVTLSEDDSALTSPSSPDMTVSEMTKSIIQFIASRKCQPLWQYEDITRTVWTIRSAEQIDIFLQHVLHVFELSLPHAHLAERWSQIALQLGLSCSSRHYAGRCLQIFRALRVPITSRMLSDILSRLVETVAEQGEDMQGYVTELMLTLEAVVDALDSDFRPMDLMKEIFKSTPNLKEAGHRKSPGGGGVAVATGGGGTSPAPPTAATGHGYHVSAPPTGPYSNYHTRNQSSPKNDFGDMRGRSSTESEGKNKVTVAGGLSRSRSAQSLKVQDQSSHDDKMNILVQLFWICLAILESDYEYEFLLGLRLLDRVCEKLPLDRPGVREKIEKLQMQLKWGSFPGVHSLLLKGCTNPNTYEATIQTLSKFTLLLDFQVVDPSQSLAFPMNVIALLPYMVQNYEDANELCVRSAENIAHVSTEKNKKLENLGTVMTLYSRRTFSKESFQWTKCVVKYLYDNYSHFSLNMLGFLVEVLEKGSPSIQGPLLTIIHCLLHYVDMSTATQTINGDLLRTVAKFVETSQWKEALKILKLAVTRSSTLVAPPPSGTVSYNWETTSAGSSFGETDVYVKKELPGRTMDFTFDLSQTPLIGRRQPKSYYQHSTYSSSTFTDDKDYSSFTRSGSGRGEEPSTMSPRRSLSLTTADSASFSGWKRPWMSQSTVRERLVNLLNSCGQRVGLPKSPSVIFSQTSEVLERQSSMASSTEEVSGPNDLSTDTYNQHDTTDTEQKFGMYMREFDFLEYELESLEGESVDNFNWGVRRPSLSRMDGDELAPDSLNEVTPVLPKRDANVGVGAEESSDDEAESVSARSSECHSGASSSISTTSSGVFPPRSLPFDRDQRGRSSTPHSETESASECSDGEMSDHDLTPCNASPSLSHLLNWGGRPADHDDTEESWRSHVQNIMTDGSKKTIGCTFVIFAKLFSELKTRTSVVAQDAAVSLGKDRTPLGKEIIKSACDYFQALSDILTQFNVLPYVWCDFETIGGTRLIERIKFNILEIQENFENYVDKKDLALECLDAVKAHLKLVSLGEQLAEYNIDTEQVDLCRCIYKLHFQLLLLLESFSKLLRLISQTFDSVDTSIASGQGPDQIIFIARSQEVADMQHELVQALRTQEDPPVRTPTPTFAGLDSEPTSLTEDLTAAAKEPTSEDEPPSEDTTPDCSLVTVVERSIPEIIVKEYVDAVVDDVIPESIAECERTIVEHMTEGRWGEAVRAYRQLKKKWPPEPIHGCKEVSEEEDVFAMLDLYCAAIANGNAGMFVMTVSDKELSEVGSRLMDANLQLLNTVKVMEVQLAKQKQVATSPQAKGPESQL